MNGLNDVNVYEEKRRFGIHTGLTDLDRKLCGLIPGQLIVIASRPGMGKTSFAMNIAKSAGYDSGKTVAFFSLELSQSVLRKQFLSGEAEVAFKKLIEGAMNAEERKRVADAETSLYKYHILIDDVVPKTVSDIIAQCREIENLGLIIIDYLQLLCSFHRENSDLQREISDISRSLKSMAKELNVPVVCTSQLSRAPERRQNKRPRLTDLNVAGAIVQDADVIIGLYREEYYNRECEDPHSAEAIILKNRTGETGTVDLCFIPEYMTYVTAEQWHNDED